MTEEKKETAIEKIERKEDGIIPDAKNMQIMAQNLLKSGMFPQVKSEAGVFTVIEYGRELGIPPVAALNTMAVINGRLSMEAKAMLAVAQKKAGVSWEVVKLDQQGCTMKFMRPGFQNPIEVSFTAKEAQDAGLLTKTSWKLYREDMLFARCASRGIRRIAPDAVLGIYSKEEMLDVPQNGEETKEVATTPLPPPSSPVLEPPTAQKQANDEQVAIDIEPEEDQGLFDQAVHSEDAPEKQAIADAIEESLKAEGVDYKAFKIWLLGYQKTKGKQYVGMKFKNPSLTEGKIEDLKELHSRIHDAVARYKKEMGR